MAWFLFLSFFLSKKGYITFQNKSVVGVLVLSISSDNTFVLSSFKYLQ